MQGTFSESSLIVLILPHREACPRPGCDDGNKRTTKVQSGHRSATNKLRYTRNLANNRDHWFFGR